MLNKTFFIINVEKNFAAWYFVETVIHYHSKVWENNDFKWKKERKIHICILQECIQLIKSDSKDIYNVTKDFYFK